MFDYHFHSHMLLVCMSNGMAFRTLVGCPSTYLHAEWTVDCTLWITLLQVIGCNANKGLTSNETSTRMASRWR